MREGWNELVNELVNEWVNEWVNELKYCTPSILKGYNTECHTKPRDSNCLSVQ